MVERDDLETEHDEACGCYRVRAVLGETDGGRTLEP
jgi:hypothetical protein